MRPPPFSDGKGWGTPRPSFRALSASDGFPSGTRVRTPRLRLGLGSVAHSSRSATRIVKGSCFPGARGCRLDPRASCRRCIEMHPTCCSREKNTDAGGPRGHGAVVSPCRQAHSPDRGPRTTGARWPRGRLSIRPARFLKDDARAGRLCNRRPVNSLRGAEGVTPEPNDATRT